MACHRLKKTSGSTSQNVIIRFSDRNIVPTSTQRRKSLIKIRNEYNYNYLNVRENLCRRTQSLYDYCRLLKQAGDVSYQWTYNGVVNIKFNEDDKFSTKLYHPEDIEYFDESILSSELQHKFCF